MSADAAFAYMTLKSTLERLEAEPLLVYPYLNMLSRIHYGLWNAEHLCIFAQKPDLLWIDTKEGWERRGAKVTASENAAIRVPFLANDGSLEHIRTDLYYDMTQTDSFFKNYKLFLLRPDRLKRLVSKVIEDLGIEIRYGKPGSQRFEFGTYYDAKENVLWIQARDDGDSMICRSLLCAAVRILNSREGPYSMIVEEAAQYMLFTRYDISTLALLPLDIPSEWYEKSEEKDGSKQKDSPGGAIYSDLEHARYLFAMIVAKIEEIMHKEAEETKRQPALFEIPAGTRKISIAK